MLTSLALIFLLGLALGYCFTKMRLPALLGMLFTGILLGPYVLNLLDGIILQISPALRQLALVIILMRAGLALNLEDLKKVGRPAVLLSFLPASCEIGGMMLLAPSLLNISLLDAAIMGAVVAAVSPAVIVPKMLSLMENGYGTRKGIPQMIMAAASVDDVFVIVLFTAFTGLALSGEISALQFLDVPVSIATGLCCGVLVGYLLSCYFKKFHMRDSIKVIILLSISFLLMALEKTLESWLSLSGLLAIMAMGAMLLRHHDIAAKRLSAKFTKLWVAAEILLFVLVGATVDVGYALQAGIPVILLIMGVICFRMLGVYLSLLGTALSNKERLFCMIAYIPKATVQAAIGGLPLAMGLSCGKTVLTVAVLAILITAPIGAFGIDHTHRRLLDKE